jgi:organic radical activating enzyme
MSDSIKELGVLVGYRCNFKCAHCCTGHNRSQGLAPDEKLAVISAINRYTPRTILFMGGETTLYTETINEILSAARDLSGSTVKITTNGHFARTVASALSVLKSFVKLDCVQLSYDRFHAEFMPFKNVENLYLASKALGLRFCVINTIDSPLELIGLKKFRAIGDFKVLVNKAIAAGEAARNGVEYVYPSFDSGVLKRRCPGRDKLLYLCGRGFSACCSKLIFDTDLPVAHASISQHKRSRMYRLISKLTLGQLLKKSGLPAEQLPPRLSAECILCEYLFTKSKLLS